VIVGSPDERDTSPLQLTAQTRLDLETSQFCMSQNARILRWRTAHLVAIVTRLLHRRQL
jgi:hypothetical protein